MQKENDVFYCYSSKLRKYLNDNNVRWFDKGVNKTSGYPYWVYEKNELLGRHLKSYKVSDK